MSLINIEDYLSDEQIKRCYNTFVFKDTEEIYSAWFDGEQLFIEIILYNDSGDPDNSTIYEPNLNDKEGQKKLKYILTGEE